MTRGITVRAAALVATGMLLPLVVLAALGRFAAESLKGDRLEGRRLLAESAAAAAEHRLQQALGPLWDLREEVAGPLEERRVPQVLRNAQLRSRLFAGTFLVDLRGTPLWADPPGIVLPGPDEVEATRREGRPRMSEVDPAGRIFVLVPVRDVHGDVVEVAGGALQAGRGGLGELVPSGRLGPTGSVDLVDARGLVLASSRPLPGQPPSERLLALLSQRRPGTDAGSGETLAVAPLRILPLSVVVRQSEAELLAPATTLARRFLALLPLFLLVALLFTWGAARSLSAPLALLGGAAERIAAGDLTTRVPPLPQDEVGRLGRSLEEMRAALAASHERLEERVRERTRELDAANEELVRREEDRAGLLRKVIAAQEEERRRIARELHDETCQTVTAIAMALDTAIAEPDAQLARTQLRAAKGVASRALDGLHRIIFDLRPSVLDDLGLVPALRWYASRKLPGTRVSFEVEGLEERLPTHVETAVFRAVQEALGNVARHARAENVLVEVKLDEASLEIGIEDDGEGFEPASVARPSTSGRGLGLLGLRERIELLGGSVAIDSAPGEGTRVLLRVPLRDRREAA